MMHRSCAGYFECLNRHLVPIAAIVVLTRLCAFDRAAKCRRRRRVRCIRAAVALHYWIVHHCVICVRVLMKRVQGAGGVRPAVKPKDTFFALYVKGYLRFVGKLFTVERD